MTNGTSWSSLLKEAKTWVAIGTIIITMTGIDFLTPAKTELELNSIKSDIKEIKTHIQNNEIHITQEKAKNFESLLNRIDSFEKDDPVPRRELDSKLQILLNKTEENYRLLQRIERQIK